MYPVIAATEQPIGLGFSSNTIAQSLMILCPFLVLFQIGIYPQLSKWLSYGALWRLSSLVFIAVYLAFGFIPSLNGSPSLQLICLYALLAIRVGAVVVGYTSVAILVSTR